VQKLTVSFQQKMKVLIYEKATYEESEGWYAGITADMFG
jgi:hypothetical protein